jgi:hypothetical protein
LIEADPSAQKAAALRFRHRRSDELRRLRFGAQRELRSRWLFHSHSILNMEPVIEVTRNLLNN